MSTEANAKRGKRNRSYGNECERAVVRYLRTREGGGWDADTTRNATNGKQSLRGDIVIADAPHVTLEVKGVTQPAIVKWLGQLDDEAPELPRKALVWKHQNAVMKRPGDWLTFVQHWPLDFWFDEIGPVMDTFDELGARELLSIVGWLDVEHGPYRAGERPKALLYSDPEFGEFLLMRFSSFADEVLPRWEGQR